MLTCCHLLPILRFQTPRVTVSVEFPAPEAHRADALCLYHLESAVTKLQPLEIAQMGLKTQWEEAPCSMI